MGRMRCAPTADGGCNPGTGAYAIRPYGGLGLAIRRQSYYNGTIMIEIRVNGKYHSVPSSDNLGRALRQLAGERPMVVELNGRVIRKEEWESTVLQAGDALELVHLVGGG